MTPIQTGDTVETRETGETGETVPPGPVLLLTGRFDAFEKDNLDADVQRMIHAGQTVVTIDLSKVVFIDSSGLAELVRAMKRCRSAGGDLILRSPSAPVQVILELTRLDSAFTIHHSSA